MKIKTLIILAAALAALSLPAFCGDSAAGAADRAWDADLAARLDALSANAWQPNLLTAFGTFTYADTALPSPFSRYLEERLAAAMTRCSRMRLFNRSVAAAMDPAFRPVYEDFFKTNELDALLSGRYYVEGRELRARLELTSLRDGVLIGTADLRLPRSAIPPEVAVDPSASASATASSIGSLSPDSGKGGLKVSLSTERGAGAVYREGEKMVVLVAVNKSAWLKVYHVDAAGTVRLIYPNAFTSGRRVDPGLVVRIPGPDDAFTFNMTPPFGAEFLKVVASTLPFSSDETAAGGAVFAELGGDARAAMTRGIAVAAGGKAERAEAMASYVIEK